MDYSLIVGIHDCERAEQELQFALEQPPLPVPGEEDPGGEVEEVREESNGVEGDEEEGAEMYGAPTPPDSPLTMSPQPFNGEIDPKIELYAIKSSPESSKKEIYFMAMIDILTKYGVKKRTAQAAKTVKHGAGAEISTVHPDQYGRRFLDFISKCIE